MLERRGQRAECGHVREECLAPLPQPASVRLAELVRRHLDVDPDPLVRQRIDHLQPAIRDVGGHLLGHRRRSRELEREQPVNVRHRVRGHPGQAAQAGRPAVGGQHHPRTDLAPAPAAGPHARDAAVVVHEKVVDQDAALPAHGLAQRLPQTLQDRRVVVGQHPGALGVELAEVHDEQFGAVGPPGDQPVGPDRAPGLQRRKHPPAVQEVQRSGLENLPLRDWGLAPLLLQQQDVEPEPAECAGRRQAGYPGTADHDVRVHRTAVSCPTLITRTRSPACRAGRCRRRPSPVGGLCRAWMNAIAMNGATRKDSRPRQSRGGIRSSGRVPASGALDDRADHGEGLVGGELTAERLLQLLAFAVRGPLVGQQDRQGRPTVLQVALLRLSDELGGVVESQEVVPDLEGGAQLHPVLGEIRVVETHQ